VWHYNSEIIFSFSERLFEMSEAVVSVESVVDRIESTNDRGVETVAKYSNCTYRVLISHQEANRV